MYDLPRNFTYGVIESYNLARGGERVEDDALLKYPGTQHAAEWHLFTSLLLPNHDRAGSSVIPVSDPEQADLFYVPFFSSLSLVVNPVNRPPSGDRPVYSDEKTQVGISIALFNSYLEGLIILAMYYLFKTWLLFFFKLF